VNYIAILFPSGNIRHYRVLSTTVVPTEDPDRVSVMVTYVVKGGQVRVMNLSSASANPYYLYEKVGQELTGRMKAEGHLTDLRKQRDDREGAGGIIGFMGS
jgi:hypothetical protein